MLEASFFALFLAIANFLCVCLQPSTNIKPAMENTDPNSNRQMMRMSARAKDHLNEESLAGKFPKTLGNMFLGCQVHPLMEKPEELSQYISEFGTAADNTTQQELTQGFDALNICSPEESYEIFDAIVGHFPQSIFAYIGRGISLTRLANKLVVPIESAWKDFEHAIEVQPQLYLSYRGRSELMFLTGKYTESLNDALNDLKFKPDGSSYVMAGILSYHLQDNYNAVQYFKSGQKFVTGHTASSYQHLGKAYINLGLFRKAIDALKTSLEYEGENLLSLKAVGNLYKQLGDAENAQIYVDKVLSIQHYDLEALESKGHLLLVNGNPKEAVLYLQSCNLHDPSSARCNLLTGISYAAIGMFYKSVKSYTKAILLGSHVKDCPFSNELHVVDPVYLRDFARYIHANLDKPFKEYSLDEDIPAEYRNMWIGRSQHNDYIQRQGIQPPTLDVEEENFTDLSKDAKVLVCRAVHLATRFQYHADGYLPDHRLNLAMGMAAIDIAQTLVKYWLSPRKVKGWRGRTFSWRDLFEVAVKWRRLVSMDQPVLWMDRLPPPNVDTTFAMHIVMQDGRRVTGRYASYMPEALQLTKVMINSLLGQKLPANVQDQVLKSTTAIDLLTTLRKHDATNSDAQGFTVGMQVPSSRPKATLLHGIILNIAGKNEDDIKLVVQRAHTNVQMSQYHAELSAIFNQLKDDQVKKEKKSREDKERIGNIIFKLVYYFYNFSPLSRGSSSVAYAVAMGAFLALNQEFSSVIPADKQPEFEAFFSGSPDAFVKRTRSWLTIKGSQMPITEYPIVEDTFPTARSIIEVLNASPNGSICHTFKSSS